MLFLPQLPASKICLKNSYYATPKVRCNFIIQIHKFTIKIETISINLLFERVKIVEFNLNSHMFLAIYQDIRFLNQDVNEDARNVPPPPPPARYRSEAILNSNLWSRFQSLSKQNWSKTVVSLLDLKNKHLDLIYKTYVLKHVGIEINSTTLTHSKSKLMLTVSILIENLWIWIIK